jgi:hypothetical protein
LLAQDEEVFSSRGLSVSSFREEVTPMARNERHVVKNPAGGWDVKKPGSSRRSGHERTQDAAADRAGTIVGNSGGGEVVIHRPNGKIRDSDTVRPGNDPNPPRDRR